MEWIEGEIDGVEVRPLAKHCDERGWLAELFRDDELPEANRPAMCYVSVTHPGQARGPHEHRSQSDLFAFPGPGTFRLKLWDNRESSSTRGCFQEVLAGGENPTLVIVPPGVAHGYRNVGECDAYVVNLPNRLYRGEGRSSDVDEIRYENGENTPFSL